MLEMPRLTARQTMKRRQTMIAQGITDLNDLELSSSFDSDGNPKKKGQVINVTQRVEMTEEEKAEFIKELKAEFKPLINDIAFSHVAPVNKKLTYRIDGLMKQTDKNFIKMKDKFEEDMLKFSSYCKS